MKIKILFVSLFLVLQCSLYSQLYKSNFMKMCSVIEKDSINSWDCIYSNNEHNTFFVNRVSFYWFHNGRSLKFKIRNEEFVDDMRVLFLDSNKDNYELAVVAEDEFIITRTSEEYGTVFMIFKRADKF